MSIKWFTPGVMYGNKVASDEIDDDAIDTTNLSYGTVNFEVGATSTGTFAITSAAQITGTYSTSSTGSATIYPVSLSQSGTTVTWSQPQVSAGTVQYTCVYIKA